MKYLLFTVLLYLNLDVQSQANKKDYSLKIGEAIPNSILSMPFQVVNNQEGKQTVTLNDYKGKLIILDFWATWCGACIAAMPKTHLLEKQFKDDLIVLPVTHEIAEITEPFLKQNNTIKELKLSSIVKDSILRAIFPHRLIPHYIWISSDGVFIGATTESQLNVVNIQAVIGNESYRLKNKVDLDGELPLFLMENISIEDDSYYSLLLKGKYPGLPSGNRFRKCGNILRGRAVTNSEILDLYEATMRPLFESIGSKYNRKVLVLDVKDTTSVNVRLSSNGKEGSEIFYNYDIIIPVKRADSLYHYMLNDLNRYTDFYGWIEKRKITCLVVVDGNKVSFSSRPNGNRNIEEKYFFADLNALKATSLPIINESSYHGSFNIALKGSDDLSQIRKYLLLYGLKLIEAKRDMNVFVLSDKYKNQR